MKRHIRVITDAFLIVIFAMNVLTPLRAQADPDRVTIQESISTSAQVLSIVASSELNDFGDYKVYLPIIMNNYPLIETQAPPCRWSRDSGDYVPIAYKWGDRLQTPGSTWRVAFEAAINDWYYLPTRIIFYESSDGSTTFNTYLADDNYSGYAQPHCDGTVTSGYEAYGNINYDHTTNQYHAIAGHETGHTQSIGHISNPGVIALMGYNPDNNIYFTPLTSDVSFVNQIYPKLNP